MPEPLPGWIGVVPTPWGKDRNVSAMNKYLADDAVLIFGDGTHFTKAESIKAIPDIRLDSFTIEPNAEIKVWTPEVATLLYRASPNPVR